MDADKTQIMNIFTHKRKDYALGNGKPTLEQ